MSAESTFQAEERRWLTPPEDDPDYLADKAIGVCPWCGRSLKKAKTVSFCWCHKWVDGETEDENRGRYAEERFEEDKFEAMVSRQSLRSVDYE